jgi:hypothetical protein
MTATDAPNPYAPPKARVVDPEPDAHGLKRRSVVVMFLFVIISFGIYFLVWWFRRRPGLNRLNSPRKLPLWPLLLLVALWVFNLILGFVGAAAPDREAVPGSLLFSIFQIVVGISMIVQSFWAKEIIEDHAAPDPESGPTFGGHVKLSGLMTFFFSIFYLQWAINRYIVGAQR